MAKKTQTSHPEKIAGAKAKAHTRVPRSHRGLARAIFKKRDAVTVGRELLQSESATVKARVWETLVNYTLGEFAAAGSASGNSGSAQFIWDIPGPPRETR